MSSEKPEVLKQLTAEEIATVAHGAIMQKNREIDALRSACAKQDEEICQTLGQALNYPWYKDDQKNFPGATEAEGVCVGEHVAESLAVEAAKKIDALRAEVERLRMATRGIRSRSGSRESRGGTRRSGSGRDGNSPRTEPGGEE